VPYIRQIVVYQERSPTSLVTVAPDLVLHDRPGARVCRVLRELATRSKTALAVFGFEL
jgi:hypothetical protein